jgi:hypothetical protein
LAFLLDELEQLQPTDMHGIDKVIAAVGNLAQCRFFVRA